MKQPQGLHRDREQEWEERQTIVTRQDCYVRLCALALLVLATAHYQGQRVADNPVLLTSNLDTAFSLRAAKGLIEGVLSLLETWACSLFVCGQGGVACT